MLPSSLPAKRNVHGRALFDAELQELKDNDTYVTKLLKASYEQKPTYGRRGFVESPLGKNSLYVLEYLDQCSPYHTPHMTRMRACN